MNFGSTPCLYTPVCASVFVFHFHSLKTESFSHLIIYEQINVFPDTTECIALLSVSTFKSQQWELALVAASIGQSSEVETVGLGAASGRVT